MCAPMVYILRNVWCRGATCRPCWQDDCHRPLRYMVSEVGARFARSMLRTHNVRPYGVYIAQCVVVGAASCRPKECGTRGARIVIVGLAPQSHNSLPLYAARGKPCPTGCLRCCVYCGTPGVRPLRYICRAMHGVGEHPAARVYGTIAIAPYDIQYHKSPKYSSPTTCIHLSSHLTAPITIGT